MTGVNQLCAVFVDADGMSRKVISILSEVLKASGLFKADQLYLAETHSGDAQPTRLKEIRQSLSELLIDGASVFEHYCHGKQAADAELQNDMAEFRGIPDGYEKQMFIVANDVDIVRYAQVIKMRRPDIRVVLLGRCEILKSEPSPRKVKTAIGESFWESPSGAEVFEIAKTQWWEHQRPAVRTAKHSPATPKVPQPPKAPQVQRSAFEKFCDSRGEEMAERVFTFLKLVCGRRTSLDVQKSNWPKFCSPLGLESSDLQALSHVLPKTSRGTIRIGKKVLKAPKLDHKILDVQMKNEFDFKKMGRLRPAVQEWGLKSLNKRAAQVGMTVKGATTSVVVVIEGNDFWARYMPSTDTWLSSVRSATTVGLGSLFNLMAIQGQTSEKACEGA